MVRKAHRTKEHSTVQTHCWGVKWAGVELRSSPPSGEETRWKVWARAAVRAAKKRATEPPSCSPAAHHSNTEQEGNSHRPQSRPLAPQLPTTPTRSRRGTHTWWCALAPSIDKTHRCTITEGELFTGLSSSITIGKEGWICNWEPKNGSLLKSWTEKLETSMDSSADANNFRKCWLKSLSL